ncbi:myoglobin-like isoform 1-T2 [Clarias gariepinus]|uniref:myoglobin-like n=1 Tax=Clarias gariepinus TaxID=13013 RepID=UPI00234D960A|nr:myoglobin-like [Clarias gariepinus]XP_053332987.1 myoglobin-like [Clarias gariepinus]
MSDCELILASWGKVESNLSGYGGDVLTRLFTEHPDTQKLFPKFVGIPCGELAGHAGVADHGKTVLTKLGEILKAKGSSDIIKPLATTHANKHKIPLNNFKLITEVIVKLFGEKDVWDAAAQDAFRRVMGTVVNEIDCVYKELGFSG